MQQQWLLRRPAPDPDHHAHHVGDDVAGPKKSPERTALFSVDGAGISIDHTERAVALALTKYCSVAASLAPAVAIETSVVVNGAAGEVVTQPGAEWSTASEPAATSGPATAAG